MPVYLDYNATALLRPEVLARMQELQALPLNPSSVHAQGREAKKHLENARKTIAEAISVFPNEIIFCSSGTEANNWALRAQPARRILVSAVEHSSILSLRAQRSNPDTHHKEQLDRHVADAPRDDIIKADGSGIVDLAQLNALLENQPPAIVSVMLANNETGVIQPISEIAAICKKHRALLHCDAIQALGKIPLDVGALGVDMLTISAHKMGGPVGAAALVVRQDVAVAPMLLGGGQELGRRAGTENVVAIAGFARAVECIDIVAMQKLRICFDEMEVQLAEKGAVIFGKSAPRLPNTSCLAIPKKSQETILIQLDLAGFSVSAGSACSSGRIAPSHVLSAMGVSAELAGSAIRISGGWNTKKEEISALTLSLRQWL